MQRIYLDNNATTLLDPRVLEEIIPLLKKGPLNPSSVHYFGQEAKKILQHARQTIADFLGVKSSEIVFTSGGTESTTSLLQGFYAKYPGCHILSSDVEHACVYENLKNLENKGAHITFLPAGSWGAIRPEQIEAALTPRTKLITLMSVNNETGVKTDIKAIAKIAQKHSLFFFVDGVSHLGKEFFKIPPGVSAMAFSSHKLHGPQGIGCFFLSSSLKIPPLLLGGSQEYGKRAGTENIAGIAGFAKAVSLLQTELPQATERMQQLRDLLVVSLSHKIKGLVIHGEGEKICNTVQIGFPGKEGETLLMQLDLAGIAVSHGSACSSGGLEPSRILLNMGVPSKLARASLRFSLSRNTTEEEIERVVEVMGLL